MKLEELIYDRYQKNISTIISRRQLIKELIDSLGINIDIDKKVMGKIGKSQAITLMSDLIKPFGSRDFIVTIDAQNDKSSIRAKVDEKIINELWTSRISSRDFMKVLIRNMVIYGTSFVETGWRYKSTKEYIDLPENIDEHFIDKFNIKQDDNGFYKEDVEINEPFVKNWNIENVVFNTELKQDEPLDWFIIEWKDSINSLRDKDVFSNDTINKIKRKIKSNNLNSYGNNNYDEEDDEYDFIKYYGYDKKGNLLLVFGIISGNTIYTIKKIENPFNIKTIPIIPIRLYDLFGSIDGMPIQWAIYSEDKLSTSLNRAIIDNIAQSNYGRTFVKKSALTNKAKKDFIDGKPLIEISGTEPIGSIVQQGNFNPIPPSIFNLLMQNEAKAGRITGINEAMQGSLDSANIAASNFRTIMNQSSVKVDNFIQNITDGLKDIFYIWCILFGDYYDDEDIKEITGLDMKEIRAKKLDSITKSLNIDSLNDESKAKVRVFIAKELEDMFNLKNKRYGFDFKISSETLKSIRIQQDNILIQQLAPLAGSGAIDTDIIKEILADMAENMDRYSIAKKIKRPTQPSQFEQQQAQMDMLDKQTEIEYKKAKALKEQGLAQNAIARTKLTNVKALKDSLKVKPEVSKEYLDLAKNSKEIANENNKRES